MPKILILDIETAPNIAFVWRFFKENVGAKQVLDHASIMSYAYKWLDESDVHYDDVRFQSEDSLLKGLVDALDVADLVIAHNGARFDLPTIAGRALVHGIKPPSPYKIIDTLLVARSEFNFPSNSLEYLAKVLECTPKGGHKNFPGFELWLECLRGNIEAWDEMRHYNIQDVTTLEEIYLKMRPYIKNHPNVAVYDQVDDRPHCPKCGSDHVQSRGYVMTNVFKFRKFQCQSCGGWSRTRISEPNEYRHALLVNTG
jgi:DNA polymerase elongation subunit (family B)